MEKDDRFYLYLVEFVAGSQDTGAITFNAWVTANSPIEVEQVCQQSIQPLQIAHFNSKIRYRNPRFILLMKEPVR